MKITIAILKSRKRRLWEERLLILENPLVEHWDLAVINAKVEELSFNLHTAMLE
jgi:hypothetical protein